MNCCPAITLRVRFLRKSKIGFLNPKTDFVSLLNRLNQDLSDHGVSKEPKWILRFL